MLIYYVENELFKIVHSHTRSSKKIISFYGNYFQILILSLESTEQICTLILLFGSFQYLNVRPNIIWMVIVCNCKKKDSKGEVSCQCTGVCGSTWGPADIHRHPEEPIAGALPLTEFETDILCRWKNDTHVESNANWHHAIAIKQSQLEFIRLKNGFNIVCTVHVQTCTDSGSTHVWLGCDLWIDLSFFIMQVWTDYDGHMDLIQR